MITRVSGVTFLLSLWKSRNSDSNTVIHFDYRHIMHRKENARRNAHAYIWIHKTSAKAYKKNIDEKGTVSVSHVLCHAIANYAIVAMGFMLACIVA